MPVSREDQIRIESKLAEALIAAGPIERAELYGEVYDRIYEMHLTRDPGVLEFGVQAWMLPFLERLTDPGQAVLEVGCGTGLLSCELANRGRRVMGVDVSSVALDRARARAQPRQAVDFVSTVGTRIPAADASFDFAFSVEMFEHLHEDDAWSHLRELHRVLRPGGRYWFTTPNRHAQVAVSERFDVDVSAPADVHLKEWTYGEILVALSDAGFASIRTPVWRSHPKLPLLPTSWYAAAESAVGSRRSARLNRVLGLTHCCVVARREGVSVERMAGGVR